ncbi:hypothetical protein XELAEV_18044286mg [Xenopus laevis]|uniref:SAM domain-containing protein n=1 Tax=Xenopus laevis TaxID=8355 RepID=A0A974BYE6_XENLA|nr:hypothetical protein XELAEV_18044286mg [Xenopus laevis]
MDYRSIPVKEWTEGDVGEWLRSVHVKENYIEKLLEEEVNGEALAELDATFLRQNLQMKEGQIQLLLKKRDSLLQQGLKLKTPIQIIVASEGNVPNESLASKNIPQGESEGLMPHVDQDVPPAEKEHFNSQSQEGPVGQGRGDTEVKEVCIEDKVNRDASDNEEQIKKLSSLFANSDQWAGDYQWHVLVTNKCTKEQAEHLGFLMRLRVLCVLDFDEDSEASGLCLEYKKQHAPNTFSLTTSFSDGAKDKNMINELGLFRQTCWILCNGNQDPADDDEPCDEQTWIRTKAKYLQKAVSFFCEDTWNRGYFRVVFVLFSPVQKPMAEAFHLFYRQMHGTEYITCIAENKEHYKEWARLAQASCSPEELESISIIGLELSQVDATIQDMLAVTDYKKNLPLSTNGVFVLTLPDEERIHSLKILCENECSNIKVKTKGELHAFESTFYRGGKMEWKHLWFAEQNLCSKFLERDACAEVDKILSKRLDKSSAAHPVDRIKLVHQPGSGGSTVARQILWKYRQTLRCAIVDSLCPVPTVCEHAVKFREYYERDTKLGCPVLLLLEDTDEDYVVELKHCLMEAVSCRRMSHTKSCFIILSCRRSREPERLCEVPHDDTVAVTYTLSPREKTHFAEKAQELSKHFPKESLITFDLMCQGFQRQYLANVVKQMQKNMGPSSPESRLLSYIALLNIHVQGSFMPISHCQALLGEQIHFNETKRSHFSTHLSKQVPLLVVEFKETDGWMFGIRICHPLIAEELLSQIIPSYPQSRIAMDLLQENILFQHRFGKEYFMKLLKILLLRRQKKRKGDDTDTLFSPLIEYVCSTENKQEKGRELLQCAYKSFGKDPYFAQHLARLHCNHEMYDEAIKWADIAKLHFPHDSFILDTVGQVYKQKFNATTSLWNKNLSEQDAVGIIKIGLKSMECFREAQEAAKSNMDVMNSSGYCGEIDVGCNMLKLLSTLNIFARDNGKQQELLYYLVTNDKPKETIQAWNKIHDKLKALYQNMCNALEWLSDDIGYFQADGFGGRGQRNYEKSITFGSPMWLERKIKTFASFYSSQHLPERIECENPGRLKHITKRMDIYKEGGGSSAAILSLLFDSNDGISVKKLQEIIDLYRPCWADETLLDYLKGASMDDRDVVQYIMCHIALSCVDSECPGLLTFAQMLEVSKRFIQSRETYSPCTYLMLLLLYWPDTQADTEQDEEKNNILINAIRKAKQLHEIRMKKVPERKRRTKVHFFLGQGNSLQKLLHISKIEKLVKGPVSEHCLKMEPQKRTCEGMMKRVPGWIINGKIYTEGHCKKPSLEVLPINPLWVPRGNRKVTFYLGFAYKGLVAYNIK